MDGVRTGSYSDDTAQPPSLAPAMNLDASRSGRSAITDPAAVTHSAFQRWLRRWSGATPLTPAHPRSGEERHATARALIQDALAFASPHMGSRDLRVYLRLLSEPSLPGLRRLRFDCFDLMCRHLSEAEAVRRLRHLDACWQPTANAQSDVARGCR